MNRVQLQKPTNIKKPGLLLAEYYALTNLSFCLQSCDTLYSKWQRDLIGQKAFKEQRSGFCTMLSS